MRATSISVFLLLITLIARSVLTAGHCCYPKTPIRAIDAALKAVTLNGHSANPLNKGLAPGAEKRFAVDADMPEPYTHERTASDLKSEWDLCVLNLKTPVNPGTIKPAPIGEHQHTC